MRNARPSTNLLLQMVEDGVVDKDYLIQDLLGYLSEDEVSDFMRRNDYLLEEDVE